MHSAFGVEHSVSKSRVRRTVKTMSEIDWGKAKDAQSLNNRRKKQLEKSLSGGTFKKITEMTAAERAGIKGSYKAARAANPEHQKAKQGLTQVSQFTRSLQRGKVKPQKVEGHDVHRFGRSKKNPAGEALATTYRTGSKSGGKSHIFMGQHRPGQPSEAVTLKHELAHAKPKRSSYRLHEQIGQNPKKLMREEARADWQGSGHFKDKMESGYAQMARRRAKANRARKVPVIGGSLAAKHDAKVNRHLGHVAVGSTYKNLKPSDIDEYIKVQNKLGRTRTPQQKARNAAIGAAAGVGATGTGVAIYRHQKNGGLAPDRP